MDAAIESGDGVAETRIIHSCASFASRARSAETKSTRDRVRAGV